METQSCFKDARLDLHLQSVHVSCKVGVLFCAGAQVLIPCSLSSVQGSQGGWMLALPSCAGPFLQ